MKALIITSNYTETLNFLNSKYRELNGFTSYEHKLCDAIVNAKGESIIQVLSGFESVYEAAGIDVSKAQEIDIETFLNKWEEPAWNVRIIITYQAAAKLAYDIPGYIDTLKSIPVNPIVYRETDEIIYMAYNAEDENADIDENVKALLKNTYNAVVEYKWDFEKT